MAISMDEEDELRLLLKRMRSAPHSAPRSGLLEAMLSDVSETSLPLSHEADQVIGWVSENLKVCPLAVAAANAGAISYSRARSSDDVIREASRLSIAPGNPGTHIISVPSMSICELENLLGTLNANGFGMWFSAMDEDDMDYYCVPPLGDDLTIIIVRDHRTMAIASHYLAQTGFYDEDLEFAIARGQREKAHGEWKETMREASGCPYQGSGSA